MKEYLFLVPLLLILGCTTQLEQNPLTEQSVMATLWYQHSAEREALCYQAYNIAMLRVEQCLDTISGNLQLAVVTDIDETILNNSRQDAQNIIEGVAYSSDRWKTWTDLAHAEPLPGSIEFARFLKEKNIELFYISNRKVSETASTLRNLNTLGYPFADSAHLLLREGASTKEPRRNLISEKYQVILLMGDNLSDFSCVFEDRSDRFGLGAVEDHKDDFGKKFIVFPNPMYGDWTKPLGATVEKANDRQKADAHRKGLLGF